MDEVIGTGSGSISSFAVDTENNPRHCGTNAFSIRAGSFDKPDESETLVMQKGESI